MEEKLYNSIHSIISDYGNYIDIMCSEENDANEKSDEARSEKTLSEKFFINLHTFRIKDDSDLSIDLKLQEKLIFILESGVLKALENKTLHTYFRKYIFEESVLLLSEQLFWIALLIKYQFLIELEEDYIILVQNLRKQIGLNYVCLLATLPTALKEELINLIIFIIGYLILSTLYALLKYERSNFSNRYIFDCFHIVLFELNGIYISDFYIKSMVEKFFTNKFLVSFRGTEKSDQLKLKSQARKDKDFFEKKLILPSINIDKREYTDFAHDLSQKLYKNKPLNIRKTKLGQKVVSNDFQKSLKLIGNVSTSLDKNSRFLTEASLHSNKPLADESFSNRSKFNCCQISPTISNILDNQNMTLQFSKKKLINHFSENSIILNENPNSLSKIAADIKKNESKVEPQKPSLKKNPSILDRYDYSLNNLNEDYRSKNKFLQEMYELKFILDRNHQKTNQYQSSLKIRENQLNERNKIPQDFLLDDGYSPHYVNLRNSLITEEERRNKEKVEEDVNQFNFDFDLEKKESNLKALLKRGNTLGQRNSIKNNHATIKIKEKPEYADLKVIIEEHPNPKELLKINSKLEEEEEDEINTKQKNYVLPDFNKNIEKYKKEHTHLIGRNIDLNIETIVSKIIKTKDNFNEMDRKMKVKAKAMLSKLIK